ncbi:MAG: acyl carrier protein, partial [Myxococcota bacterium]
GDLGIDSIKRVEILSAMQEKEPSLPEVDASAMASLQTLGQIVEYMGAQIGSPVTETPIAGSGVDLKALLLEVVAEKTGYPAEMLTMDMTLEGDLGIDSIKRVEILSSMQEKEPSLPEVDASAMASLQTLGQIVDYMGDSGGNDLAPTPSAGASVRADSEPVRALGVGRYGIEVVDAPALGMSQPGLQDGQRVVITSDGSGVAEELVRALGRRGIAARVVTSVPENAEAVLFLGGLRPTVDASVNQEAFLAARAVAGRFTESGGMFVTVQDTGGAFGLTDFPSERAWSAGLAALARTAAQEWPAASVKAIDLQRGERSASVLAEAIVAELMSGGPELEVGLTADGRRQTLRDVQTLPPTGESLLGADDVVVVSGGARGVTAASVIALAAASRARFVLLGRTAIKPEPACVVGITDDATLKRALMVEARATGQRITPADLGRQVRQLNAVREIQATLAAVSAAGGQAQYVSVDVTDEDGVASALSAVRSSWGPITGIIHGAGVIADKRIADKPPGDFDWVFNTKVGGLQALLRATEGDPLRALVMFSSVAARCGNVGQSDYAMANEVLNKVAESIARSRPGCRVRSLGWGPWEGGMVSPQLKARFEQLGVTLIPLDAGAQLLVDDLLSGDDGRVELTMGGAPRPEALLADGASPETALDLHIDRKSHPYLAAHAINGIPVVPVVLAVEWFSRAARAMYPTLHLVEVSDVRVLRGIQLSSYLTGGDLLRIRCEQVSNGDGVVVRFSLRGADGHLHYTATGKLHPLPPPPRGGVSPGPVVGSFNKSVYTEDGVLFHGPDFQVIDTVEGVSDEGISASMRGVEASGWPAEQWRTDAAAFDGGLQLALLWSERVLGGASLPTGIGRIRTWTDTPDGPFRCVLTGSRSARGGKAISDLVFFDRHGEPFAELSGVETHLLPNRTPRA